MTELNALAQQRYVDPAVFIAVVAGLGEKDDVLEWFEKAYEDGSPNMAYTKLIPLLFSEGLETDSRFQELLRRMDLL